MTFDWAAQPFFTLIATFTFAPFFVTGLVGDGIRGQALWGYVTAVAALAIGVLAPWLGALTDATGYRRGPLAICGAVLMIGSSGLWFAHPGDAFALHIAMVCIVLATVGAELATVVNNAMIRDVCPPRELNRLAWSGWALGSLSGIVVLFIFLGFLTPAIDGKTLLGLTPWLGADNSAGQVERFSGPFTAVWFMLFAAPALLLNRETAQPVRKRSSAPTESLFRAAMSAFALFSDRRFRPFLIANMLLSDALIAMFTFGGIYGAVVFGWGGLKLGLFGIAVTIMGAIGVTLCIWLDAAIGARRIAMASAMTVVGAGLFVLGLKKDAVFFLSVEWRPDDFLSSTSEGLFTLAGLVMGLASVPLQSSLRTMAIEVAPARQDGQWFGLCALSGKSTAFIGPLMVALAIDYFGTQGAGLAVIVGMFAVGLVALERTPAQTSA